MSGIIPGGRQRTASEGDILEYDNDTILTDHYGYHGLSTDEIQIDVDSINNTYNSVHTKFNTLPRGNSSTISDTDHDSNSSGLILEKKSKSKLQPFKAVKKSVARMVRQAVFTVSSSGQNDKHDRKSRYMIKAIVTPTFGRKSKYSADENHNQNQNSMHDKRVLPFKFDISKWPGDVTPGIIGLKNHGNTCFINAVIQCLSNTDLLTEYFVTEKYKDDLLKASAKINSKKNGTNGEITKQIAVVLQSLWTQRYTNSVSEKFKTILGKCNSQYLGYSQHDAQEFLLWLLDKLHEELSLVSKKKSKLTKSPSPCPDDEPTPESLPQSKSFVYSMFQALHRSSLTCPNCKKHSNTFDPYVCVSLPLPLKSYRPVYATVVMLNSSPKQVKIALSLDACGTIADLRQRICADTKIPLSQMLIVQYYDDGWRQSYSDDQPLSDIPESETVYVIEMLDPLASTEYNSSLIQIILVNVERLRNPSRCVPFCSPEVIQVPRDISYADLQTRIINQLGDAIDRNAIIEKDEALLTLRIIDGIPSKCYLSQTVDMPLYTETVDEALSRVDANLPPHLKVVVEWDRTMRDRLVVNDADDITEHSSVHQMRLTNNQATSVSLDECFELYTREEKLSGDDPWLCPYCKKQQLGTIMKLGLWSLPDVLVIHLKRFRQVASRRSKLNTFVSFPVSGLDMSRHVIYKNNNKPGFTSPETHSPPNNRRSDDNDVYDLYAVCNHYGNMLGGHYTAFCKSPIDQKWYTFDDSSVRAMPQNKVTSGSAYILFYQRRSIARRTQSSLASGEHWIFQLSKTFLDSPGPERMEKLASTSPKRSPSRTSPESRRKIARENNEGVVVPQRGRLATSTLPRSRREHSAPASSNRAPLGNNKPRDASMQESPKLRRNGSERRSDQNLSRSSWVRSSVASESNAAKICTASKIETAINGKVSDVAKEKVTFDTTQKSLEADRADEQPLRLSSDYAENLSVVLPPPKSPNQKSDVPKSILKPPSGKFDTLPRQKTGNITDKTITITESKSAHELSQLSNGGTVASQTDFTPPKQKIPLRINDPYIPKSNHFNTIERSDQKSGGSASPHYLRTKDTTTFAIRGQNFNGNSPRSSSGSDSYVSARNVSGSDEYVSPRSSYTSSPKSPQGERKSVRISVDDKQTVARSLFPHSHIQPPHSDSHLSSVPRITAMPGTAYNQLRPHPRPRLASATLTNANHSFWDKPPPAPAPPVFNPFRNKKHKLHKSDSTRRSIVADTNSLDRFSHLRINTGVYDHAPPAPQYIGPPRAPSRISAGDSNSCLKESSV